MDLKFLLTQESMSNTPGIDSSMDFKEFYRVYVKEGIARPDLMIKYGLPALETSGHMGVDKWILLESLFVASIELGDAALAKRCLDELTKEFPESVRVGILQGRELEAQGKFNEAIKLYNGFLEKSLGNLEVMKRLVCCKKSMGDLTGAVKQLHNLLDTYQGDVHSWKELSEIHLLNGDLKEAAHCLEELVMSRPISVEYHNKLADINYSINEFKSVTIARKHYAISLRHQEGRINLKAVYGLAAAGKWLMDHYDKADRGAESRYNFMGEEISESEEVAEIEKNRQLYEYAQKKLREMNLPAFQ